MENVNRIPMEILKIIPVFDGETRTLPLFIKKCEYILQSFQGGNVQNEYLFHIITSRLSGDAANLVGERELIHTWEELKELLNQHFGDPRSEECLAMELESLKRNRNESYVDFCHRIQQLRSSLFSKVSETIDDANLRTAKHHIYNNTSLNVFLYNLPAYLVRLVRLRNVTILEDALKIVLEEQNFQTVYDAKNPRPNLNRNQNNNNPPRFENTQRLSSAPAPNRAFNQMPHTSNQQSNSFQYRNNRQQFSYPNNRFNGNNMQHVPRVSRSPPAPVQMQAHHQQFAADNRHRAGYDALQPVASGSNTDVTMRTANSRRVNYTENNHDPQPYNPQGCDGQNSVHYGEPVENFYIEASIVERK